MIIVGCCCQSASSIRHQKKVCFTHDYYFLRPILITASFPLGVFFLIYAKEMDLNIVQTFLRYNLWNGNKMAIVGWRLSSQQQHYLMGFWFFFLRYQTSKQSNVPSHWNILVFITYKSKGRKVEISYVIHI